IFFGVLGYAARQEGVSRIGILHTQDAGGEAGRDAIRAAAVSNGVQVVTQASYERSQTGINDAAEAYTDAFINAGLDGLFFTDGGSGVVYAVSFLPYFGLDMDGIQTMSIQPMDGAEFSAERPLRGTLYAVPDPQLVELFGVRYRQAYGAAPDPLASLSYDAVAAVGAMIATAREAEDTAPFDAEDIRTPLGFAGVNGIFRFSEDGALERGLSVMQVTEDGPVMVSPAPQGFGFGS
ncbi:MAG: ABC transporter substrate-binding protein, partial [Rubricella sp.]